MLANKIIQAYARKALIKNQGSGITNIPNQFVADAKAGEILTLLKNAGIPINQLDDYIRSEADLLKFLNLIKASSEPRVISGSSAEGRAITEKLFGKKGEVVEFPQKRTFKEEIEAMKKSGDIVDPNNLKKNDNVLTRAMFQDSNLNKVALDRDRAIKAKARIEEKNSVTDTITYIKTLEPIDAMKEANSVIGRKGKYKDLTPEESKKILQDTEDHIFQRDPDNLYDYDPEDMAKGGRAGLYTGGMVDVEPNLSDIGHGSDALMARTRLVSPDGQATTSTGLNYLLAEDNDNIRVPFSGGGGMSKRAFLKLLASLSGTAAAFKTGILGLGEGAGKKAVTETVKQAAESGGQVPPYFLNLVSKIKTLGDDTLATKDKAIAKKYKDYTMEEDFSGNIEIIKKGDDVAEDVFMSYKVDDVPVKGKKGSTKVEEYEEFTARPDQDGKMKDIEQGVPDEVVQEGTVFEDTLSEFGKADGGRIGFSAGGGKFLLSKLGINSTSRRFLEKVFGKEKFNTMIENDPEMHVGMLEVVEMFRNKNKSGLVEYMQNFLPKMSKKELEAFIKGSGDNAGIEGQLIRLGSGRDYKGKLDMIEEANNVRKLKDFDIDGVSKNAEGGRIGFSGGGIFRAIIAKAAAAKGMKPYEFIKVTSYKSLPPEVKMFLSADDFAKLKSGQQDLYTNYIDMAKTRKNFQEQVEGGKTTPARELFEGMEKSMDQQSYVPKTVTSDDIAQMELMVKNRFNKGRKDNAQGGLQTMLGE